MPRRKEPAIPNELLDQLLAGGDANAAFDQGGLLDCHVRGQGRGPSLSAPRWRRGFVALRMVGSGGVGRRLIRL